MTTLVTSQQMCDRAGITYRQLDHWVRRGLLTPAKKNLQHPGTGRVRWFTHAELAVAVHMGALVAAGASPEFAERLARPAAAGVKIRIGQIVFQKAAVA